MGKLLAPQGAESTTRCARSHVLLFVGCKYFSWHTAPLFAAQIPVTHMYLSRGQGQAKLLFLLCTARALTLGINTPEAVSGWWGTRPVPALLEQWAACECFQMHHSVPSLQVVPAASNFTVLCEIGVLKRLEERDLWADTPSSPQTTSNESQVQTKISEQLTCQSTDKIYFSSQ